MSSNIIIPTKRFQQEAKRLAKKFVSLKAELTALYSELEQKPDSGKSLGNDLYKIRIAVKSKGKGKRGGLRMITYSVQKRADGYDVFLISIYDKSEDATITKEELQKEIKNL